MQLQGSYVALVTPMNADGSLALEALSPLLEAHLSAGTAGIVAAGTTGESASLTDREYRRLVESVVETVAGRCPVIAGAGSPSTRHAIELASIAREAGADALLCVTPYYLRTTQEGLYRHFLAIAEAVPLPLVLYNVPGRTGVDLLPATVARLAGHPQVVAIKEAVSGAERVRDIREACDGAITVLSGDDGSCLAAQLAGAAGVISVTANLVPAAMTALCRRVADGDAAGARTMDERLGDLHRLLMAEPNPIPVKWALAHRGLIPPGLRLPLVPATPDLTARLVRAMDDAREWLLG